MSLDNYLAKSSGPALEIRSGFAPEQVQALYNLVKATGRKRYFAFVKAHLPDILLYIGLSPSRRDQKKWVSHPHNLLLRLAALQISDSVVTVLNDLWPIASIVDRGSYRSFHSAVADALAPELLCFSFFEFPFEGFDNPFFMKD